ncbi:MAG: DUF1638 domain-containing protein [bacterium]|jgi:hypothetical protein
MLSFNQKKYKLITCEIFYREFCWAISRSTNRIDVEFLPKGLHDVGQREMSRRLKNALEQVDESRYDAILLGYGLCNNGIIGLQAGSIPLVLIRAHDCITMFMGSRQRYQEYFESHSGVYFLTTGWIERGSSLQSGDSELSQLSMHHLHGLNLTYQQMVEKYGEENAKYLQETLGNLTAHYSQFTFIEMGVEPDERFENFARREAEKRGYQFEKVKGNLSLFQRLVDGEWNEEDFLLVPPGNRIEPEYHHQIIRIGSLQQ